MKIKNIVFDLGGVLLKLDRNACVEAFTNIGFETFGEILNEYVQDGFFLDFEKGKFDSAEFRDRCRKHINQPVTDEMIDSAMKAFLIEIPKERLDYIKSLKGNYNVYMLSNTNPIAFKIVEGYFEDLGYSIQDCFDKLYLSYQMKSAKPDAAIFKMMLSELGSPQSVLFIDDSQANLEAARQLGINTLMIDQQSEFEKEIDLKLKEIEQCQ
ncbi:D-ribitol-5-phosphate phosphatase [bioreactor metagenome]|uniref:D-ribitol-5-phosphate phosphatase n=1 Tax=bioreactor metagenome TaxID=1076179 RepID=A0A645FMZ8_9ZZZZ